MVIDLPNEEWRDIEEYEGLYQVSNKGRVKSLSRYTRHGRFIKEQLLSLSLGDRYLIVSLSLDNIRKTYSVHRLVAKAFLSNPNNLPMINHKDEDPTNNLVENLEWCTCLYNNNYGTRNKRLSNTLKGHSVSNSVKSKISKSEIGKICMYQWRPVVQISKEGEFLGVFPTITMAAKILRIGRTSIRQCCIGSKDFAGGFKWRYANDIN